jgi:glyoxylase-like metal-dependent hydrolase (beta-lactamase superfamily II)
VKLGDLDLWIVSDGEFRLDGGAMFGVVPKVMWEKAKPADERNRIRVTTNCVLVRRGSDLLLVDTGLGEKHDPKFEDQFGFEVGARRLPDAIRALGFELGDVTHVLLSHLHFDHAGWNTRLAGERVVPTFPNARYWLERGELAHAQAPNERDRASYDPRDWEPLLAAGVVELFDGEAEPVAGVRAVKAPGHNADMCIVLFDGRGGQAATTETGAAALTQAVFWADLVPTSAHVPFPWIMGYDLYPLTTLEHKKLWLPRAAAGGWLALFEHDPVVPAARIVERRPGRFEAEAFDPAHLLG